MAFESKNLSVLAYANGFTLWHYATTDTAATVDTAGYYNGAADMLRVGDMILANVDTDGTPMDGLFVVNANAGGVVDVADMTRFGGGGVVRVPFSIGETDLLAGTAQMVASPVAGNVTRLVAVVQAAIGTGGTMTVEIGGTPVDGLAVAIGDAAAAGTVVTDAPSSPTHATTVVAADQVIAVVPSAAFATSGALNGYLEITPPADSD